MENYSDQEIIQRIRNGGTDRDQITVYLLTQWQGYGHKLAEKYHLNREQQKDAYTDAIVKLVSQVDQGQFKGQSALSSYFFSILNNTCVDVLRIASSNKNKSTEELHEWTKVEREAFELIGKKDLLENIRYVIEKMGDNCRAILIAWGFQGHSMKEIAKAQLSLIHI